MMSSLYSYSLRQQKKQRSVVSVFFSSYHTSSKSKPSKENGNRNYFLSSTLSKAPLDTNRTTKLSKLNKSSSFSTTLHISSNVLQEEVLSMSSSLSSSKEDKNRSSLLMELTDRVGILHDVLRFFWKYDVNITRIESRPCTKFGKFDFFIDFEGQTGDDNVEFMLGDLKKLQGLDKLLILDEKEG